jgi:hypothetical protein
MQDWMFLCGNLSDTFNKLNLELAEKKPTKVILTLCFSLTLANLWD